ncbi:myb-like protein U [Pieris napi]|uniref:myb-like protein U n=1 Tax=Pieris napi TaxID=78633 RepID=UPI001FBB8F21|nr:myb-like protein U [Pieris napi]
MKPKTIAFAFLLVVTISLVQGLPRSHRFKPVVNLNPEKVTTTQKPIEVRKSTLFPKNTKKKTPNEDVIQPISSPTTEKTARTLSPVQKDTITKSYSLKGNKDEINETAPEIVFIPVNISELKSHPDLIAEEVKNVVSDISNHASQVTQSTTKEIITESYSLKGNKDESSAPEIVFIPVDLSDLKSHPYLIAEEVNEIKKHTSTVSESSTSTTAAITSTSTNPSITTTPTVTTQIPMGPEEPEIEITAKGEQSPSSNNRKYSQNPDDDVKNIIYHTPNNVLNNSNNDVTTETSTNVAISSANNSSPEILFIPVNLDELKSHPNLIANEMKNIIDNINRHPPKIDITTTTSTITNEAATVLTTITPSTTSTTTTTTTAVIDNSVYNQNPNAGVTTEQSEATPKVDKPITSSSSHDMIFLPVNLADLKAHPNAIEDEIKDVSSTISLDDITTENAHSKQNVTAEKPPDVVFIPVNLNDLESNPAIADEWRA